MDLARLKRVIRSHQFWRFCAIGIFNTLLYAALNQAFIVVLGLSPQLGNLISFVLVVVFSFLLNKYWTFQRPDGPMVKQASWFLGVNMVGMGLSSLIMFIFHQRMGWPLLLVSVLIASGVALWNFWGYKKLAFRA